MTPAITDLGGREKRSLDYREGGRGGEGRGGEGRGGEGRGGEGRGGEGRGGRGGEGRGGEGRGGRPFFPPLVNLLWYSRTHPKVNIRPVDKESNYHMTTWTLATELEGEWGAYWNHLQLTWH